jgi:hypothetical protein
MTNAAYTAPNMHEEDDMLTDEEVVSRYKGRITLATLRNWRNLKIGPAYVKVGKAVLYRRCDLIAWDHKNRVACSVIP